MQCPSDADEGGCGRWFPRFHPKNTGPVRCLLVLLLAVVLVLVLAAAVLLVLLLLPLLLLLLLLTPLPVLTLQLAHNNDANAPFEHRGVHHLFMQVNLA